MSVGVLCAAAYSYLLLPVAAVPAMHIGPNRVTTHEPTILPSDAEETNALRLHGRRPLLIRFSAVQFFRSFVVDMGQTCLQAFNQKGISCDMVLL
jgi:hypothetical protein